MRFIGIGARQGQTDVNQDTISWSGFRRVLQTHALPHAAEGDLPICTLDSVE